MCERSNNNICTRKKLFQFQLFEKKKGISIKHAWDGVMCGSVRLD